MPDPIAGVRRSDLTDCSRCVMTCNVVINGYGRIGKSVLRAVYEESRIRNFRVVAINSQANASTLAYQTSFDSTYGRFPLPVESGHSYIEIDGDRIEVYQCNDLSELPWNSLKADLLLECSGVSTGLPDIAGAGIGPDRVLFSRPVSELMDSTVVYGYNHHILDDGVRVASTASCTTNALVPMLEVIDRHWGVENGVVTTIHSAMNDQAMVDRSVGGDLRLGRSGIHSIVPVDTSLGESIARVMPELAGRFSCSHVRVPAVSVSAIDLTVNVSSPISSEAVNKLFQAESGLLYPGVMTYVDEPVVSIDFSRDSHSCVVDGTQTQVNGGLLRMLCWFDSEWAYANRMLDVASTWLEASSFVHRLQSVG